MAFSGGGVIIWSSSAVDLSTAVDRDVDVDADADVDVTVDGGGRGTDPSELKPMSNEGMMVDE